MNRTRFATRTALAIVGLFVVTGCGLTSCSSTKSSTFTQSVSGENGRKSSVSVGDASRLPGEFPRSEVPLPAGKLQAVVTGDEPPNHLYNLTFKLAGKDGRIVAMEYRDALEKVGFKIENYNSTSGTDGGFTQFDAIGKRWDVLVVGGKANIGDRNSLSVQVSTHGTLSDLGDGTDSTDSSTTTTTILPGG